MGTIYTLLAMILAGAALGYGWSLGGQLATASVRFNKKQHIAAAIIVAVTLAAVVANKVPMPF